ncbi:MAG TPA: ATP-binding protein, partial [Intrasporangium sp.]|uniref:ATP-binding protein n=1 Tax=Intrasporangium sp. TaxID=1925024 RepID=UPI002B46BB6F
MTTIGRTRELARARERLAGDVAGGVAFVGPAGIGKSTVLAATAGAATDLGWQVVRTRAAASERDLPYVGLHDLIGGAVHDKTPSLADPLRRALDVVLLRADPPEGGLDTLAVDVAVLEVLQAMAEGSRLLLVLDDLQWIDAPTRQVLEFAVRRLDPSRVGVLAASRNPGPETLALLPEPALLIEVGALTEHEVADLVALRTGRVPSPQRAAQLHRLSEGNPFLALELARGHEAAQSRDDGQFSVPERYRELLAERLSMLSPAGRRTVLAAALLSRPTRAVITRVGGRKGLVDAEAADVLHRVGTGDGEAVEFDHPLLAAACRDAVGPVAVREMHLVLASLSDDPVERAQHVALGTTDVDSGLAEELEAAAMLAAERTAIVTAAGLARDALRLTPRDALDDRVRRAVLSSGWFMQGGEPADAESVVSPVLAVLPAGSLRAQCLVAHADALGQEFTQALVLLREAVGQPGLGPDIEVAARMRIAILLIGADLERARLEAWGAA